MLRRPFLGVVFALCAEALACSRDRDHTSTVAQLSSEEAPALAAVLVEAGVEASSLAYFDRLHDLDWRGAESHARAHGLSDRLDAIRKRQADTRNAVAVEGGHVVGLRLGHTRLTKLGSVSKLTHLVVLDLHDGQIADVDGLRALPELDHLDLAGNRITSLAGVSGLPAVRSVYLADNPLERIDGLEDLPKLEVLNLAGDRIAKIDGFGKLEHLRALSLERNPIERIEGLEQNEALEELNLAFCRIAKIENVGALKKLLYLDLWHNRVASLEGVETLGALVYLGLGENPYDWGSPRNQAILREWGAGRLVDTW